MARALDELNIIKSEKPEEYFGKMELTEEQTERRIEYTEKANELFDVILILLLTMRDNESLDYAYARGLLESWLFSLIAEFTTPDDYLIDYATDTAYNFVDTTGKHIDEPWYTSADRSLYNAENSANDVLNYDEYQKALESGKTHKKWITEKDNRVRESHKRLEGKTIPIKEYFRVGVAKMRFPKDYEYAGMFPEELVNCRCKIEYLPKDKETDKPEKEESHKGIDRRTQYNRSEYTDEKLYAKVRSLGENADTTRAMFSEIKETIKHRDGTHYEDLTFVNSVSGNSRSNRAYNYYKNSTSGCVPNKSMKAMLKEAKPRTIIGLHNHPTSNVPTIDDLCRANERQYKYGIAFCHNGVFFKYSVGDNFNEVQAKFQLDILSKVVYTDTEKTKQAINNLREFGVDFEVLFQ